MSKPVFEEIFTFSGRRNRFSYNLFSLAECGILFFLVFAFIGLLLNDSSALAGRRQGLDLLLSPDVLPLVILGFVPLFVSYAIVTAQRCRDIGLTGWAALLVWIPYLGVVFGVALMLIPGTRGANRYGPDPLSRRNESFDENKDRVNIDQEESCALEKSDISSDTFNLPQKKSHDFRAQTVEVNFSAEEKFSDDAVVKKEKPHSDKIAEQNGTHSNLNATRKLLFNESSPDERCGALPTKLKTRRSNRYRLIGSLAAFVSIAAVAAYALTAMSDSKSVLHFWSATKNNHNINELASKLIDTQNIGIYQNALEKKYGIEPVRPYEYENGQGEVYDVDGCLISVDLSKSRTVESISILLSDECRVAIEFSPKQLLVINGVGLTEIAKKINSSDFEIECLGSGFCSNSGEPTASVTELANRHNNYTPLTFTTYASDINQDALEQHAIRLTGLDDEHAGLFSTIMKCTDVFDSAALELLSDEGEFGIQVVEIGKMKSWEVQVGVCEKELKGFLETYPDVNLQKVFDNIESAQQRKLYLPDELRKVIAAQKKTKKRN